MKRIAALLLAAPVIGLAACCAVPAEPAGAMVAVPGKVTDVAAFDRFIGTKPTPADFHARYPDVVLVLPGQMATKEMRLDRSRYFAELDGAGRITGGQFQ